jgi:transcriptional regulator with XRE-family HTH domain
MNGDQLRMARALLRLTLVELAEISGVDKMGIVRMEAGRKPHSATVEKLRKVFVERGVIFIGAVEPYWEPGVAMAFGKESPVSEEADDEKSANVK